MVSSGAVLGDLNSLKSIGSSYTSEIEGLSDAWKGPSHDNLVSKAEEFISEFISTIESQMNAYATACDLYEQYKVAKQNKEISERNYQKAIAQNDNSAASTFAANANRFAREENSLKTQIESQLRAASSTRLSASASTADTITISASEMSGTDLEKDVSSASGLVSSTSSSVGTASSSSVSYAGGSSSSTGGSYSGGGTTTSYSDGSSSTTTTVSGSPQLTGNVIDTSTPVGTGTKYNLSDSDINFLAYVARREQGSVEGAKLELSLMANLYEKNKSKYSSVTDYVKRSGWFGTNSTSNYYYPGDDYVQAAREVLTEGNRYLASNVVEHDCISDITSISTGSQNDRSNYIPGETIIHNKYGANYVFVGFAPNKGDPFGYLV